MSISYRASRAGLTARDYRPIPLHLVTPGTDHALITNLWPDKADSEPSTRMHRVTVESVTDGWATVTAHEEFWATGDIRWTDDTTAHLVRPGDTIKVRFLGRPWADVGARLDAQRDLESRRREGIERVHKALPDAGGLGAMYVDVEGLLALLEDHEDEIAVLNRVHRDETERLNAHILDLQERLGQERERADRAQAHERVAQGWGA